MHDLRAIASRFVVFPNASSESSPRSSVYIIVCPPSLKLGPPQHRPHGPSPACAYCSAAGQRWPDNLGRHDRRIGVPRRHRPRSRCATQHGAQRPHLQLQRRQPRHYDRGCLGTRKRARAGDHGPANCKASARCRCRRRWRPRYVQRRALCSAAASTSVHLYRHGVEIDAIVRIESERLRAGLQEARRWHVRTVVSAVERAAARRLRAAEASLELALARNAELDARLRQAEAEGQAWQDMARSHERVAAGLRATLDNLMQTQPPCAGEAEGDAAEDAQSCCFELEQEEQGADAEASGGGRARGCRWCGAAEACVLLLPCRHLCLCGRCEAAVEACPVCRVAKNASVHVLLD